MSTVAPQMWSDTLVGELVGRGIDAIRPETAQARGLWQEFGWGGLGEPRPPSDSSIERESRLRGPVDDQWGRSESLDPDDVGDIADEGMGHRG
jgi:hypothetical protein